MDDGLPHVQHIFQSMWKMKRGAVSLGVCIEVTPRLSGTCMGLVPARRRPIGLQGNALMGQVQEHALGLGSYGAPIRWLQRNFCNAWQYIHAGSKQSYLAGWSLAQHCSTMLAMTWHGTLQLETFCVSALLC